MLYIICKKKILIIRNYDKIYQKVLNKYRIKL